MLSAKSLLLCPTLCDPVDGSLPGSSLHGILQARTLEWVAMPFSRETSDSETTPASPAVLVVDGFFTPEPKGKP